MKQLISALIFVLIASTVHAQYVGITRDETIALKKLIAVDAQVRNLYSSVKKSADAALAEHPNPVDTVVSEGHLATDPKKIMSLQSLKDIDKIYALALTYRVESKKEYLQAASGFINAWSAVNQPQGNPINDTKFESLFFAYDMLRNELPAGVKGQTDNWLRKMADAEIRTGQQKAKKTSYNNWNSHRLKVIGSIAWILDEPQYKAYIAEELPAQIEKNLLPDGSGIDFLERDALHYHIYTLEPLINLAAIIKRATGKDFYNYTSPSGASIKKSIDFLIPFVTGEKTHPEFVNSKVAFDKKRADNKEPGYETGALFKPQAARGVMIQASWFQPDCLPIGRKLMNTEEQYPNWQTVVNAVRK